MRRSGREAVGTDGAQQLGIQGGETDHGLIDHGHGAGEGAGLEQQPVVGWSLAGAVRLDRVALWAEVHGGAGG